MKLSRRDLFKTASIAGGALAANTLSGPSSALGAAPPEGCAPLPPAFDALKPLGDRVKPIRVEEFQGRIAHAQQLMGAGGSAFDALYITPGTTLRYFTGIRWGVSERIVALLIPRSGDPLIVCPAFEERRLREQLRWPIEVRAWQEDESPYALAGNWLSERGNRTGRIGVEETTHYVFFDGLRQFAPKFEYASGDPITHMCRARKSAHELELMRLACQATFDVYKAMFASLREGMRQSEIGEMVGRAYERMGLSGDAFALFGPAAFPHGTHEDRALREGDGVLIDDGCTVEGYGSDVTRTGVFGKPSEKLQRAFETVRKAQDAALAAAVAGHECGSVDDAARKVVIDAGFGPGYKLFAHRLGHGIGMDGHEWPYLVHGSRIKLEANMTFSNEPGIYAPGDYGLRCEDDMAVSESGEAHLLTPGFQPSLETPIA
ncbi:MAG TPA: Xaa-Pro peptidase family protein [Candidatus Acidoferrum sp.]|nr:Xaa-Pro peptidase family protein [Candidatus Acidoferrum sp.]